MRLLGVAVLLCALPTVAMGSSVYFLEDGIGARAKALGYAYSTAAHEADSIAWNPAGLGSVDAPQLTVESANRLGDIQSINGAFCYPLSDQWGLGIGLISQSVSGIELRDVTGNLTSGSAKFESMAIFLGTGFSLSNDLRLGVTGKWLRKGFSGESISAFPIDIGVQYDRALVSTALVVQNLNSPRLGPDSISRRYVAGVSLHPFGNLVKLNSDYAMTDADRPELYMGAEFSPIYEFSLRIGYPRFSPGSFLFSKLNFGTRFVLSGILIDGAYSTLEDQADYRVSVGIVF